MAVPTSDPYTLTHMRQVRLAVSGQASVGYFDEAFDSARRWPLRFSALRWPLSDTAGFRPSPLLSFPLFLTSFPFAGLRPSPPPLLLACKACRPSRSGRQRGAPAWPAGDVTVGT